MVSIRRWWIAVVAMALSASGLTGQERMRNAPMAEDAQQAERPIAPGVYTFIPSESDEVGPRAREAVEHLFFAIRGIARRRLEGANEPIDRIDLGYRSDTLVVSLREGDPPVKSLMNGDTLPYTRPDGEVVQVTADVEPGMIDLWFIAEDGRKEMIFQRRDDGKLAVESVTYSDKLEEPFRYTWVYAPPR